MTTMADTMAMMEHPESSVSVPPLVDPRVLDSFCRAIQAYADSVGCHDEIAEKLRILRLRLDELRGLASLGRLAIVGHGRSLGRVADELNCVTIDFPCDPLERIEGEEELNEDERDTRVQLGAAIDLFAAASFCSKGRSERRDRFVVGAVRNLSAT